MNKKSFFFIVLFLLSVLVYAREVPNTSRGVANAVPGDYLIRSNGQRVILNRGDIDHARRQLGLNSQPNRTANRSPSPDNTRAGYNSNNTGTFVFFLILGGIILWAYKTFFYEETDNKYSSMGSEEEPSKSQENPINSDLIAFYRNLLGLRLRFTHNELKLAYRDAVIKYHPDRYNTSEPRYKENAEILMKQINEAHETLKRIAE